MHGESRSVKVTLLETPSSKTASDVAATAAPPRYSTSIALAPTGFPCSLRRATTPCHGSTTAGARKYLQGRVGWRGRSVLR
ncbi:MAG: hypothetical protein ACREJ6_05035, partial [Candidatus Methylomirabilis sp.]